MSRQPGWKQLTIGIVAAFAVAAAALAILVFGRVGRLHGKTITLFVTTDGARGVISGTEVWLDGQKVGTVNAVTFRPPSVSQKERLVIALDVLDKVRPHLRLDSSVDIRPGGNLIGDMVVFLGSGTARTRGVANGDTIHGGVQADVEEATSDMTLVAREFPGIMENVKLLAAQLQTTQGTLGALGIEGGPEMRLMKLKSTRLVSRVFDSRGTIGLIMNGSLELHARAASAMAEVDSIRALLASDDHSLGRFRRDSTLMREIARVRSELAEVQRLAENAGGTIGRARADSVIVRNLHRSLASMDSLIADVKKHPLRYLAF